jgi:signal transduction histidine kinase
MLIFGDIQHRRLAALIRLAGLGLVVWAQFGSEHAPGLSGRGLLVVAGVAWLAWTVATLRTAQIQQAQLRPDLFLLAGAGGILLSAAPGSAASVFVFVAVVSAGIRAESQRALSVTVLAVLTLGIGALVYDNSGLGVLAYALGFGVATLAAGGRRQSLLQAEQADLLLAQTQRTHEEQLRAARLEESTRIAREIHDVLAHALAGLTIQLEATAALVEQGADRDTVLQRVRRAHQLAREGLRDTRLAVGALRGDRASTADRIEQLLSAFRNDLQGGAELSVAGDLGTVTGTTGEAAVRVIQEALTNVRKHAPGAAVTVAVEVGDDQLEVVIEDRIPVGAATGHDNELHSSGGGYGLPGMRERAAALGGSLDAGPTKGGWRVTLRLPLPAETAAPAPPAAPAAPAVDVVQP